MCRSRCQLVCQFHFHHHYHCSVVLIHVNVHVVGVFHVFVAVVDDDHGDDVAVPTVVDDKDVMMTTI